MSKFESKIAEIEQNIRNFNQPWTEPVKWSQYCDTLPALKEFRKSAPNFISIQDFQHHLRQEVPKDVLIIRAGSGQFSLVKIEMNEIEKTFFLPPTDALNPIEIELPSIQLSAAIRLSKNLNEQLALNLALQAGVLQSRIAPGGWRTIVQTWQRTFPKTYVAYPFKEHEKCSFNLFNAQWEADAILQDVDDPSHFYLIEAKANHCQLFKAKLYFPSMLAFHFLGKRAKKITPIFFVGKLNANDTLTCHVHICRPLRSESKIEDVKPRGKI